jgi:putative transposase
MSENRVVALRQKDEIDDPLTEILRSGAKLLIAQPVEAEFDAFLASHADHKLPDGRQRVVRHGHDPVRTIQTGIGAGRSREAEGARSWSVGRRRAHSLFIGDPKWARRTKSLDALLPALYLRGISAGDFQEVLTALLGKDAPNLSRDRRAQGRVGRRISALAGRRFVGPALRLGSRRAPSAVLLLNFRVHAVIENPA